VILIHFSIATDFAGFISLIFAFVASEYLRRRQSQRQIRVDSLRDSA
jgi:hypothetical protein